MSDTYKTIERPAQGGFRDRGSKFLAYAFPVYTEEEWQEKLAQVKKEHPKARHYCYAYRLGTDQNRYRANDDGEPSGTAGRPILGQIDSFGLSNILIVVVRYFGGTKLGTSGLINAYKTGAQDALSQASIIEKTVEDLFLIRFDYALMSEVMNAVKKLELEICKQQFENTASVEIAIRHGETQTMLKRLKALIAKVRLEEVDQIESVEGLDIRFLCTR